MLIHLLPTVGQTFEIEIMRLTPEMWNEFHWINARAINLHGEAFSNDPASFDRVRACNFEEINAYKIKLEIFFSETDIKEQSNVRL